MDAVDPGKKQTLREIEFPAASGDVRPLVQACREYFRDGAGLFNRNQGTSLRRRAWVVPFVLPPVDEYLRNRRRTRPFQSVGSVLAAAITRKIPGG
ncbi:MAG: hypothetical protein IPK20_15275 [Betaproteobacteria bacterium]|nr:hypothetical protein [Betaproteobacteria bacterium]